MEITQGTPLWPRPQTGQKRTASMVGECPSWRISVHWGTSVRPGTVSFLGSCPKQGRPVTGRMPTMTERESSTSIPIIIDRTSPVPVYFQLAQHFESAIRSGARKGGAGTVVANERIDRNVELTSLYDDLAASGRKPATQVLKAGVRHASDQVADALQLPERALVMSLERIRLADGEPMALMHNYLPAGLVQLNVEMLEQHGLYELLRASGVGLYSATQ